MTDFLLGGILSVGVVLIGEGYAIFGRMQLFLTTAEQILAAEARLLGTMPGKSAQRTVADKEQPPPSVRYAVLRALAALRDRFDQLTAPVLDDDLVDDVDAARPTDLELDRWADDGGRVDVPAAPQLAGAGPDTRPVPRIDIAAGLPLRDLPTAPANDEPDDVDLQLARWGLRTAEGHRR